LKVGSKKELDFAFEQLDKRTDSILRRDLIFGLSCSKELWVLSKLLNQQLENKVVDPLLAMRSVAVNPVGNPLVWNFLKNNWNYIFEKYSICSSSNSNFRGVLKYYFIHQDSQVLQAFHSYLVTLQAS